MMIIIIMKLNNNIVFDSLQWLYLSNYDLNSEIY